MRLRESLQPVRMARVAIVAPAAALRDVLVRVADAGTVELEQADLADAAPGEAAIRLQRAGIAPDRAALSPTPLDLDAADRAECHDLMAGEAQLELRQAAAVVRGEVAAMAGWMPVRDLRPLRERLAEPGGAVVLLHKPPGGEVPTLLTGAGLRRSLTPLVQTYGTVPYADIDPTPLAWAAYVLMFGMMFGDAGHGLMLLAIAAMLWAGRPRPLARFRRAWPFVAGAGVTSTLFGVLYGEFFGPSGLVPVLWLAPMERPIALLLAAVGVGAVLLAGAYVIGTVNRWREGGWSVALYVPSGIAGAALFFGLALAAGGWYLGVVPIMVAGGIVAGAGLSLAFVGFLAGAGAGGAGVAEASVEVFDLVTRLGSNVASFARLAAFGLAHAALATLVWNGAAGLWGRGGGYVLAAAAMFVLGTAVAFTLEALVAAVQALRLEYYELFSRLFQTEGRPFRPWHLPTARVHPAPADTASPKAGSPNTASPNTGPEKES